MRNPYNYHSGGIMSEDRGNMPLFSAHVMLVLSTLIGASIWTGGFLLVMWFLK